jgi:hypothetical protein
MRLVRKLASQNGSTYSTRDKNPREATQQTSRDDETGDASTKGRLEDTSKYPEGETKLEASITKVLRLVRPDSELILHHLQSTHAQILILTGTYFAESTSASPEPGTVDSHQYFELV